MTAQTPRAQEDGVASLVARLRAEHAAQQERSNQALLLHEVGALEETSGEEPAAVRDYLAAFNADSQFREPLEQLLRILQRRKSIKNLGKLLDALTRAAETPEERARAFWEGQLATHDAVMGELATLIRARAWPSEHIRWGLIEPLRIYADALRAYAKGATSVEMGRALRRSFNAWAAMVPLDHVWASLSAEQLRTELQLYENRLLRPARARGRFRRRLLERFGDVTAIRVVLGRANATTEGAK